MTGSPANVVLLAAGQGRRLGALTRDTHKALLPVAGKPVLQRLIDAVLCADPADVVIVTGDKHESIERFVRVRYGDRIRFVFNPRHAEDTNILSTELGVAALRRPDLGYLIVETDLVIEPAGWRKALAVDDPTRSYWVTHGTYSIDLTGGALQADPGGRVTELVYAPSFCATYAGWHKLLGMLYVAGAQVETDRRLRRQGLAVGLAQYYMTPWVKNLSLLPCWVRPLGEVYAASFNDTERYHRVDLESSVCLGGTGAA